MLVTTGSIFSLGTVFQHQRPLSSFSPDARGRGCILLLLCLFDTSVFLFISLVLECVMTGSLCLSPWRHELVCSVSQWLPADTRTLSHPFPSKSWCSEVLDRRFSYPVLLCGAGVEARG